MKFSNPITCNNLVQYRILYSNVRLNGIIDGKAVKYINTKSVLIYVCVGVYIYNIKWIFILYSRGSYLHISIHCGLKSQPVELC